MESFEERRGDARFRQPLIAHIRAVLRPGHTVALVDLSAGGALVRTARVLRPGARVHVGLHVDDRTLAVLTHVLRCSVASLGVHGIRYLAALKFDERCETLWASGTHAGYPVPEAPGSSPCPDGHLLPSGGGGSLAPRQTESR